MHELEATQYLLTHLCRLDQLCPINFIIFSVTYTIYLSTQITYYMYFCALCSNIQVCTIVVQYTYILFLKVADLTFFNPI